MILGKENKDDSGNYLIHNVAMEVDIQVISRQNSIHTMIQGLNRIKFICISTMQFKSPEDQGRMGTMIISQHVN